jgi:hypothetical protein
MSGSEPLLVMAKDKRAEIPSTSQVRFPVFDKVTLKNMGEIEAVFEVFIVEGEFRSLAEGSKIVTDIANTSEISTPIVLKIHEAMSATQTVELGTPSLIHSPIVSKLATLISSTLKVKLETPSLIYSPIVSKLTTLIESVLKTQEQCSTSIQEGAHTYVGGLSHTIEANTARRDITVLADSENIGSVIVGGMPLQAGQFINLNHYSGAVSTQASDLTNKIYITEVIK